MADFNSDKKISIIYVISTLVIASFYFYPRLNILIRFDYLACLTALYYFCFIAKYVTFRHVLRLMIFAIPFCFLMFISRGLDFKYGFIHNFMGIWNLIIPSVICIGLFKRNRPRELCVITWTSIFLLIITCVVTLYAMMDSVDVMRELTSGATDQEYAMSLRERGVGGFGIAYAMGAFAIGLFVLLQSMPKFNIWKWIILTLFLFSFYFVTQAQFTTLLIITFTGVIFALYLSARTSLKRFIIVGLCIILIALLPLVLKYLIYLYQDSIIGEKLLRMYTSIWGDGQVSDFSGKRSLYQLNAFKLFLNSPIWGNNITQQPNAFIHHASHSTLLAVACSTGLIGIWSYIVTFYTAFRNQMKLLLRSSCHKGYVSVAIYYLLFAIFNPVDTITEVSWVVFVIIPSLFKLYVTNFQLNHE